MSSSAQIVAVGCVDAIERLREERMEYLRSHGCQHLGPGELHALIDEVKSSRARVAELEAALKVLPLENGHTYGCQCRSWLCATRRKALENR